jgi:hypothetical protein
MSDDTKKPGQVHEESITIDLEQLPKLASEKKPAETPKEGGS